MLFMFDLTFGGGINHVDWFLSRSSSRRAIEIENDNELQWIVALNDVCIYVLFSENPGFKSRPAIWLSLLRFLAFASASPGRGWKSTSNCAFAVSFHVLTCSLFISNPDIRCYIMRSINSCSQCITNKQATNISFHIPTNYSYTIFLTMHFYWLIPQYCGFSKAQHTLPEVGPIVPKHVGTNIGVF